MFKVYEIDYHDRAWLVGEAKTLKNAKSMARMALKESGGEFPTFITCGGRVACEIRGGKSK